MFPTQQPFTEQSNPLTTSIDVAEPAGMARLFRQCNAQVFTGWGEGPAMMDDEVIDRCVVLARRVADVAALGAKGTVVVSGAGTSGRIAHLVCRQLNRLLRSWAAPEVFRPLVVGGQLALLRPREGAEDDTRQPVAQFTGAVGEEVERGVFIGVTCGLTAGAIAAQVLAAHDDPRFQAALVGFNTPGQASTEPIEGLDRTFRDILDGLLADQDFILLNPIVGPEAIRGSTRLKGGSATKLLLEAVLLTALEAAGLAPEAGDAPRPFADGKPTPAQLASRIRWRMIRYREATFAACNQVDGMARLIQLGTGALRRNGSIYYIGRDTAGILGLIDASECPPTFGAEHGDVRGYLRSGWPELLDEERDPSGGDPEYAIDHQAFEQARLPELELGDLVMGVAVESVGPSTRELLAAAARTKATTGLLFVRAVGAAPLEPIDGVENVIEFEVPSLGFAPGFPNVGEYALKLGLNALSTGAFIAIGKVYGNEMIDLRIANIKLYHRALRIVADVAMASDEQARDALHAAAFRVPRPTPEQRAATPAQVVAAASGRTRIVPAAIVMARRGVGYPDAVKMLAQDPVVRRVIEAAVEA